MLTGNNWTQRNYLLNYVSALKLTRTCPLSVQNILHPHMNNMSSFFTEYATSSHEHFIFLYRIYYISTQTTCHLYRIYYILRQTSYLLSLENVLHSDTNSISSTLEKVLYSDTNSISSTFENVLHSHTNNISSILENVLHSHTNKISSTLENVLHSDTNSISSTLENVLHSDTNHISSTLWECITVAFNLIGTFLLLFSFKQLLSSQANKTL